MDHDEISQVAGDRIGCTGTGAAPHPPVEILVERVGVARCPVCNRRFRRAGPPDPDAIGPAAWPSQD